MNIGGLVSALLPVFFVLALGYLAGRRNAFNADQAAGLSKLAISYALPASLFVGMTDIPRPLLLEQGPLVLALILALAPTRDLFHFGPLHASDVAIAFGAGVAVILVLGFAKRWLPRI